MIILQNATAIHAALLADIHREAFPHYWNIEAFNDFFGVANSWALLAETASSSGRGNEAIGMIVYRVQYEQADIITMAVRPEWRRQGIARRLLKEALVRSAGLGAESLFLDVEERNAPALKLYESEGFIQGGRRKQYYRQKDGSFTDALVMVKKLP